MCSKALVETLFGVHVQVSFGSRPTRYMFSKALGETLFGVHAQVSFGSWSCPTTCHEDVMSSTLESLRHDEALSRSM